MATKKKKNTKKNAKKKNVKKKTTTKKTTKKKVTSTKKASTKKNNVKKTTTKKNSNKISNTQVIKNINDDQLKTQISLPIIEEEINQNKNNKLHEYDLKRKKKKKTLKCKPVLTFAKTIKKNKIKQYNSSKGAKASKNKNKINNKDNDELSLLKYRDYKGLNKIKVFFINRLRVIKFDMKRFGKKFKYGTLKDKILILFMLCLIAGFSLVIAFCAYIIATAPEISEKRLYKNNATVLLDKDGKEFARLGTENREKVSYDDLPEVLIDAIVATEDSRYFQHNGIDLARFTKAAIGQVLGNSNAGGGSTLTMQVSKNAATSATQSIVRKFMDIYLSVFVFERKYTKEQIMEFYVNIPLLGAGAYGVEQASQIYFGKSVSELNLTEAATIAGLFQAPSAYNPYAYPERAESRRNTVLNLMYRHGYISKEERDAAKAVSVESLLIGQDSQSNEYQDFIDTVIEEVIKRTDPNPDDDTIHGDDPANVSMTIWTTLDRSKQEVVNDIMTGENYSWKNEKAQAGIAVIDVDDGSIAAIGASRDKGQRVFNFATSGRRHPGSVAKPVLDYGPAIEYLNWSTGQTIIDDKMTYTGGASIKNFDNGFKGVMTIKEALAQSRNIPALYTFQQTTHEQKLDFSSSLGWTVETNGNGKILESCSIGGFEGVTAVESAAAYATFARGGTYIEPHSVTKIEYTDSGDIIDVNPIKRKAMSSETAYMINMILKHAVTSGRVGAGSVSGTDIAAKTGTSTVDSAAKKAAGIKKAVIGDSWEVAYSPDYAIATWYGYSPQISKDYYLTSSEGGTARKTITKKLVKGIMKKNSRFKKPSGIVTAEIEIGTDPLELASDATPKELRSKEYFKKGTVPTTTSTRFAPLENPTNLKYTATDTSVTLSWNAIATPNAINQEWLKEYFNNSSVYKKWADKYLEERIKYNNKTFGTVGYHVYLTNSTGTHDLGFTTNTTYTTNVTFDQTTKFTVKASYQKFKNNQSSGISVDVQANSSTPIDPTAPTEPTTTAPTTTVKQTFAIEYIGPSCSTVSDFNSLGNKPSDKIRVTSNGNNVTSSATISHNCYTMDGNEVNCSNLTNGTEYEVLFTIRYSGSTRNKRITLKNNC